MIEPMWLDLMYFVALQEIGQQERKRDSICLIRALPESIKPSNDFFTEENMCYPILEEVCEPDVTNEKGQ